MRKLLFVFLALIFLAPVAHTTDWYVRADGGAKCDGKADAAYAPGVTHCALNDVGLLDYSGTYATAPKWIIAGGDTVHIGPGQFRCGYRGPNAGDHQGLAIAGNPFAACFPSVPSGTATNPTRFIGEGSGYTQIYAGYGAGSVFGLGGASFVTLAGIELTDHGQCSRVGTGPMCSTSYPLDDDAGSGITTDVNTHDIVLRDMNIHGFTSRGIIGPIGGLVTATNVRIAFNGGAGWDFDDGKGTKSAANATVNASGLMVEGNGCNEEYPIVHPLFPAATCYDQNKAGYGDGIGTPNTPLNFTCDHCTFRYNTQDGGDLLHVSGSWISITNSSSYGNMGQQWKMGAMKSVDFENNTTVHNCNRLSVPMFGRTDTFSGLSLFCRAGQDAIAFSVTDGGSYTFKHNSLVTYGATSYDIGCVAPCTKPNITFQGNINMGYPSPLAGSLGSLPAVYYWTNDPTQAGSFASLPSPILAADHNIYYRMRTTPSDGVAVDPLFVGEPVWTGEASLDNFSFALSPGSPAIAMGAGADAVPITTIPAPPPPPAPKPFLTMSDGTPMTCSFGPGIDANGAAVVIVACTAPAPK